MKITYFRIENFRNIRLAECENPPDFMVVCGGNGCGKSAILEALMTAREHFAEPQGFQSDPKAISADSDTASIRMRMQFSEPELAWQRTTFPDAPACPREIDIVVELNRTRGWTIPGLATNFPGRQMLSAFTVGDGQARPGYFDYFHAFRPYPRQQVNSWQPNALHSMPMQQTLGIGGAQKFQHTKAYLVGLAMHDMQELRREVRLGRSDVPDSLRPIREFFSTFFAPKELLEVDVEPAFRCMVRTPRGDIDIDDLSAGEKEVLNVYIRFHQLQPKGSIILFDEADAHLHPELERRYLQLLRRYSADNQVWLTTHSPEMMIEAGADSLWTIDRTSSTGQNQFRQVSTTAERHDALAELMGSRGLVSFNQKVVFIEGTDSSADRQIYEHFYPPSRHNVSFVPTGNSSTVRATAERIDMLLEAGVGFQQFYSIVDGDVRRAGPIAGGSRLVELPVYHVENFLLDERHIFDTTRTFLRERSPFADHNDVVAELRRLLLEDDHLLPYCRAVFESRMSEYVYQLEDDARGRTVASALRVTQPNFNALVAEGRDGLRAASEDGSWKQRCKARELLKAYCGSLQIRYDHFRNFLLERFREPPPALHEIMRRILDA